MIWHPDDYAGTGDDRAVIAVNRHGIAFAREAVGEYGIDRNYFDPVGKVNGAVSAKALAHNESYARHLATLGEPARCWTPRQMHRADRQPPLCLRRALHPRHRDAATRWLYPRPGRRAARDGIEICENSAVLAASTAARAQAGVVTTPRRGKVDRRQG